MRTHTLTFKELLKKADNSGYAIPSFNFNDCWDMTAIIEAAEELRAPVIIAAFRRVLETLSTEIVGAMGNAAIKTATVPVILHLDHCEEVELCKRAVDNGFASVMIDGSSFSLEENIRRVKEVTEYAHARGVFVEAELGRIKGRDSEGVFDGGDFLIKVDDAVKLVKETGADLLAPGIGTAHGFYKGKPEINFDRLKEVDDAVDIPLVLHGGTGIPEEDVRKAIKNGICKLNVGTIIRHVYMTNLKNELNAMQQGTHILDIQKSVRKKIKEEAMGWIRFCMADGKA
jgi:ketose-bisphosphate aldolase